MFECACARQGAGARLEGFCGVAQQGVGAPHAQGAYLSSGGGGTLSPQHQAALRGGGFLSDGSSASEEELQAAVRTGSRACV